MKDFCTHLHSVLSIGQECDINGVELFDELQIFVQMLPSGITPAKVKSSYMDTIPNIFLTLRILQTLSFSVASGERSFVETDTKLFKIYFIPRAFQWTGINGHWRWFAKWKGYRFDTQWNRKNGNQNNLFLIIYVV